MKNNSALVIVIILSLAGCLTLLSSAREEAFMAYGFIILAVLFLPIWLGQRKRN